MAATSLDYRDFSLVCKAFQLKENGPNGMICLCGLDKEDIIFSKDEESDIDSVNSWGLRVSPMINDFILLETIMVPTCDDDISSIEKLRKIFRDMSPYKRLVWCGRLLIEFHEENQCSRYLSSALKFYVKAIEYMRSVPVCQIFPDDTKIKELVKLSSKFRVHQSAFIELLRLFSTHGFSYLLSSPTIDYVLLLEDIFRATNELKIDILVLWKKVDNRSYLLFNDFVHKNIEAFIPLIKFGKTECISIESGEYLTSSFIRFPMLITVNSDYRYNSTTFRSLQTLRLFFLTKFDMDPTTGPYALKLLWNSITEPFLCQEEFKKSVITIQPFYEQDDQNVVTAAWDWYVSHVLKNVLSPRGPRPLAHLSRCSVRRQLATCLQLPCGVLQLDIPKIVKYYILLEH